MVVLKEPKRLPVDLPVGPSFPPDWLSDYGDVHALVEPIQRPMQISSYARLTAQETESSREVLGEAMSLWLRKVDVDLVDILGVSTRVCSRGDVVRSIKVNMIMIRARDPKQKVFLI